MSILEDFIVYLESFPALQALAPEGLCTELAGADTGAALCGAGTTAGLTYLSGTRCETRRYRLLLRAALLTNAQRGEFHSMCEALCAQIHSANEAEQLPHLQDSQYTPEGVACAAAVQTAADDSGVSTFTLLLQLQLMIQPPMGGTRKGRKFYGTAKAKNQTL